MSKDQNEFVFVQNFNSIRSANSLDLWPSILIILNGIIFLGFQSNNNDLLSVKLELERVGLIIKCPTCYKKLSKHECLLEEDVHISTSLKGHVWQHKEVLGDSGLFNCLRLQLISTNVRTWEPKIFKSSMYFGAVLVFRNESKTLDIKDFLALGEGGTKKIL